MKHSENIAELAAALAKAQGEMEGAAKASVNPHFKAKYADLASCWDAIREPLSKHGLSVVQLPVSDETRVSLTTLIMHSSGQWIEATYALPASKPDAQGYGSALTYMRRYALVGLGIAPEDDDGNAAVGRPAAHAVTPDPARAEKARAWAKDAADFLEAPMTMAVLKDWETKNAASVAALKTLAPAVYNGLTSLLEARRADLKKAAKDD